MLNDTEWLPLLQNMPVGMVLIDREGWIRRANARFCERVGYSEHQLNEMRFDDITHPQDIKPDRQNFDLLQAGKLRGNSYQMTKRFLNADGRTIVSAFVGVQLIKDHETNQPIGAAKCVQFLANGMAAKVEERGAAALDARPVVFLSEIYRDNRKTFTALLGTVAAAFGLFATGIGRVDSTAAEVARNASEVEKNAGVVERKTNTLIRTADAVDGTTEAIRRNSLRIASLESSMEEVKGGVGELLRRLPQSP